MLTNKRANRIKVLVHNGILGPENTIKINQRWDSLAHYLDYGVVPMDNNQVERQIRLITLGKKSWLFS